MFQVETYEAISLDEQDGIVVNEEVSEEALALIESLGLSGQKQLLAEKDAGGEVVTVRSPYRLITAEELAVFGAIMPNRTQLEKYDGGPVPLRVLQIAAHAKPLFDELQVWAPEPGRDDPLLVGVNGGSSWGGSVRLGGKVFVLARWGDVLQPFEALRAKAREILKARVMKSLAKAKAEITAFEQTIDAGLDAHLLGERTAGVSIGIDFSIR